MSTPDEVLEKTRAIILERGQHHGNWRSNMDNIADLWSSFLGRRVSGDQVAVMLGLVKVSRMAIGNYNTDDYEDAVGYFAIAAACAEPEETEPDGNVRPLR